MEIVCLEILLIFSLFYFRQKKMGRIHFTLLDLNIFRIN